MVTIIPVICVPVQEKKRESDLFFTREEGILLPEHPMIGEEVLFRVDNTQLRFVVCKKEVMQQNVHYRTIVFEPVFDKTWKREVLVERILDHFTSDPYWSK